MLASLPYTDLVGAQDPLALLASTPTRIAALVRGWDARRWAETYAPGKWTAAQLILHLAHDEIGWCNRDRKSTRLNSSHTVISYAVFCLKKKKAAMPAARGQPSSRAKRG